MWLLLTPMLTVCSGDTSPTAPNGDPVAQGGDSLSLRGRRPAAIADTVSPGTVTDLSANVTGSTSVTLSFTQVTDGTGQPAQYDVRSAVAPISWGSASSVTSGTCSTPLAGTAIGAKLTCTVLGLSPSTSYNFQLVPFRGTLNVNAKFGGLSNVAAAVTTASAPAPVASVTVTLNSSSLTVGQSTQAVATLKDANGNTLTGRTVTYTSSNASVASVSATGLVTAVAAGNAVISAASEGVSDSATLTVTPALVASVTVTLNSSSLTVGQSTQAVVTLKDASGNTLTGRVVTFASSNTSVATVSSTGLAMAVAAGTAVITATSEAVSGSATLSVTAPAPAPVASV